MVIDNATIPLIEPLTIYISGLMNQIKLWVGGLFGLYFIFFTFKLYAMRKNQKNIRSIRRQLGAINSRLDAMGVPPVQTAKRKALKKYVQAKIKKKTQHKRKQKRR